MINAVEIFFKIIFREIICKSGFCCVLPRFNLLPVTQSPIASPLSNLELQFVSDFEKIFCISNRYELDTFVNEYTDSPAIRHVMYENKTHVQIT